MEGGSAHDVDSDGLAHRLIAIYRLAQDGGEMTAREALRSAIDNADLRKALCGADGRRFRADAIGDRRISTADPAYRLGFADGFAETCARFGVPDPARSAP